MSIKKIISEGILIKKINNHKFSSIASVYSFNKKHYVVREIGHQYSLKLTEFNILEKDIKQYYKNLKKTNTFRVPDLFEIFFDTKQKRLLLLTEYFKNNAINNGCNNLKIFKKIALILLKLVSLKDNVNKKGKLNISIDINPNNFFISNRDIVYNDFTPPLFRQTSGKWTEFRRIDEKKQKKRSKKMRYFSAENVIVNFLNKARLHLTFDEYKKLVIYVFKKMDLFYRNKSTNVLYSLYINLVEKADKNKEDVDFNKYITKRDVARFKLTLNKQIKNPELGELFKKFKN